MNEKAYVTLEEAIAQRERKEGPLGEEDIGDITMPEPRGWLLSDMFCRGFHSSLVGAGGVGKTAVRYAQYLSLASGKMLTGEHIFQRARVLILSFEDGVDELKRRLWSVMNHHGIEPAEVAGWLFYAAPGRAVGKLAVVDETGSVQRSGLVQIIEDVVVRRKIDVVGIDPIVKAHDIPENNNTQMDKVMEILTEIAIKHNIATDAPGHVRKGIDIAGNADAARGASAQKDAGRLVYTLTAMSKDDAASFGVKEDERRFLVRVDSAKVNIAPKPEDAKWFKLVGVSIGNVTALYPSGDSVQTVEVWKPPKVFAGLLVPAINAILDELEAGMSDGERFSSGANARDRAAWKVVARHVPEKSDQECRKIIAAWIKSGLLTESVYQSPKRRSKVYGVFIDATKRPT